MVGEPSVRFGVSQFRVAEDFTAQFGQGGVVFDELGPRVDMVVVVVVLAIVIEPALHPLGEVFVVIHGGVGAPPQPSGERGVMRGLDPRVEGGVDIAQAAQVNVMSELVDQNALRGVRIAGVGQQVLFGAGTEGVGVAAPHAAGAGIAIILGGDLRKVRHRQLGQPRPFGLVGRELIVGEDAQSRSAGDHRLADIRPLRQHQIDQVGSFLEGVRADPLGSANGITLGVDHLGVKRGNAILSVWVIAVGLHRH